MHSYGSASSVDDSPELILDERWNLTLRIASSPHFAKAIQLRDILLYITRRYLSEGVRSITETDIALSVLQRRSSFDPNEDGIVRVQISNIRKRLDAYYAAEGKSEEMLLTIPKGAYLPQFKLLHKAESDRGRSAAASAPPVAGAKRFVSVIPWTVAAASLLLLFAAVTALGLMLRTYPKAAAANVYAQNPLLSRVFHSPSPVSIVIADSSLSMVEDTLETDVSVHNYVDKDHVASLIQHVNNRSLQGALQTVYDRQYTSLGEATVAFRCEEISRSFGNDALIRYARYLHVRDFEKGNFVLIGSRRGVPWVELFESQLNFSYEEDLKNRVFFFRNLHPQAGEQAIYMPAENKESYVDIALVPNLGRNGHVLLLRGLTMEANESAVDFLAGADSLRKLPNLDTNKSVEILLRNHVAEGASSGFDIVAVRQF